MGIELASLQDLQSIFSFLAFLNPEKPAPPAFFAGPCCSVFSSVISRHFWFFCFLIFEMFMPKEPGYFFHPPPDIP